MEDNTTDLQLKNREKDKRILSILIGVGYFIGLFALPFIFILNLTNLELNLLGTLAQICSMVVVVFFFYKLYKLDLFNVLKEFLDRKNYANAVTYFAIYFALLLLYSFLLQLLRVDQGTTDNQQTLDNLMTNYPVVIFIFTVLLAPVVEELIFRFTLYNCIKNKLVAIHVVAFVFMAIHVVSSIQFNSTITTNEMVLAIKILDNYIWLPLSAIIAIPSYLIPSYLLTINYHKFHKLSQVILIHTLVNLAAFILFYV